MLLGLGDLVSLHLDHHYLLVDLVGPFLFNCSVAFVDLLIELLEIRVIVHILRWRVWCYLLFLRRCYRIPIVIKTIAYIENFFVIDLAKAPCMKCLGVFILSKNPLSVSLCVVFVPILSI